MPVPERKPLYAIEGTYEKTVLDAYDRLPKPGELKRCPFCGGTADVVEYPPHDHSPALKKLAPDLPGCPGYWAVECGSCETGLLGETRAEAIERWNTRAQ